MKRSEDILSDAKIAFAEGNVEEALRLVDDLTGIEDFDLWFFRGEIYFKLQRWGNALNCFRRAGVIAPENVQVNTYVEMINNILSFYHTDQFNPWQGILMQFIPFLVFHVFDIVVVKKFVNIVWF